MTVPYFDAHVHIDRYAPGLVDSALQEIEQKRILTCSVSMDTNSYDTCLEIERKSGLIRTAFGIHPWHAPEVSDDIEELDLYLDKSEVIGEIGLDFHWITEKTQYAKQYAVFEYFLAHAREHNKVVNLHTKGAEKEVLRLLKHYSIKKPLVHWYSGSLEILDKMIDHGCWFSSGVETLSSEKIQEVVRRIPEDRLLTETDNPGGYKYLTDWNGMPSLIGQVVMAAAACKKISPEKLKYRVLSNALELYSDTPGYSSWIENNSRI